MRYPTRSLILAASSALGVTLLGPAPEAAACGACVVQQSESTEVVGHRMIFSVSPQQTTLWDQIRYAGSPESFAWILPVRAPVEVDLSSDALFEVLEEATRVQVFAPSCNCGQGGSSVTTATATTAASTGSGGGVTVIASETVGPYETVQLASADGQALIDWLASHNYVIPDDLVPVVEGYVADGMDFLAMKLVPGEGVSSMRPVRVSSPGAGLTLPLRMVAGGAGAYVPLHLWVVAEGRYEPQSHPWFVVKEEELVWNWDTQSSNYDEIVAQGQAATAGRGWLVASSDSFYTTTLHALCNEASFYPEASGYDDGSGDGEAASALCNADVGALLDGVTTPEVTHLFANLPHDALDQDLVLQASADQEEVSRVLIASYVVGTPPCDDCGGLEPPGASSGAGAGTAQSPAASAGESDCAYGSRESSAGGGILVALLALAGLLRPRRAQDALR